MRSFLLASLASLAAVKSVNAHPMSHNSRMLSRRAVDLDSFRMVLTTEYKKTDEVASDPAVQSLSKRADAKTTAEELVKATVEGATFRLATDSYVGKNGIAHFYFKQTANDLDIDNADFNVNIGRDGKVFSFGNSFYKGEIPEAPSNAKRATVEPQQALKTVVRVLQLPISADAPISQPNDDPESFSIQGTSGTVKEPEAKLVYIQTAEGKLKLAWRIETDIWSDWLLSYVDAETGEEILHVVNYAAEASYEVYPWGLNDPTEGERIIVKDPSDPEASEFGWHSTGSEEFDTTRGNNGIAQSNWENRQDYLNLPRPVVEDLTFHFPYSTNDSDWKGYSNASITQLFYTSNKYHDLLHVLGFDEAAGNFEVNNNGAGGVGNDMVILNTQDGSGTNNANFLTPPDGTPGRMRMYIWTTTNPPRDSSFEAGVVIHEYTHGLSNRLTGGPANAGCLNILEAGGMGEGWSDFYATAIRLKPSDTHDTDYPMGAWVNGDPGGIRNFLYSTSLTTNPQTYKSVDRLTGVHPIGNVWASILYEVLWNLIDKHGKNDADKPEFDANGVPTDGKYLALKLVLDGMALQPCNPNFVTARNAIIDADENLTGGSNACELWSGFAKRGLGEGAVYSSSSRTQSFDVPAGVC